MSGVPKLRDAPKSIFTRQCSRGTLKVAYVTEGRPAMAPGAKRDAPLSTHSWLEFLTQIFRTQLITFTDNNMQVSE